ncbi:MAG: MFS transporter [Chloroflexi bacterium]|nr:MFS transporter [Chloroflexota bacterium]
MSNEETTTPIVELGPQGWRRTFDSLSVAQFRLLVIGAFFSHAGMQMTNMARPWLAFHVSGSALMLGLVAASQGIPQLIVSPLGGVAADRLSKRLILHVSTAILILIAGTMAVIVYLDIVKIWHLVVLSFVHGSVVPFNQPARQSYVPFLVPRAKLGNALGLFASIRNLNQIIGPSIAGILIAIEPFLAFTVIVALQSTAFTLALWLPKAAPIKRSTLSVGRDLIFGLRYIWSSTKLRTLVGLGLVAITLGFPYQQLLPVFQKEVLDVGPERLGFMYTALGTGALTASLLVATFSGMMHRGFPQLLAGIAFGIGLVAFALSPVYLLSVALLFVTGLTSQMYTTLNSTQMMLNAEPQFYGRIASINMMSRAFMPLVVLPFGALVDAFGAPTTVATAGVALMCTIVLIGALRPALWRDQRQ